MATASGGIEISKEKILEIKKGVATASDFKEKIENSLSLGATEILEVILGGAVSLKSSDVHIEPGEKEAKIRIRIDGLLQDIAFLPVKTYILLLSRIKLLSGIKFNVSDKPQDGRFSIIIDENPIEIRCSTLPAEHGESVVLRVLNPKSLISLQELGLREDLLKLFKKEIQKPHGMIIIAGPTGSGKTTTLYSFLKELQKPEIKIITIEDPIEYKLEGISQTQVSEKKGYTFASGLRSIMRQDPDVILIGEIRDYDTAQIALQAALTGHLVLSTLHANDAAGTVPRLTDLGAGATTISPALNIIIAERLIRKVCKKCAELIPASEDVLIKIKKSLENLPKESKLLKLDKNLNILKAKGCKQCNSTGYSGRIGIFEAISIDAEMEKFILQNPSNSELREFAAKKGMVTMYQDGIIKVLEGITTLEEVERAAEE